ncbi:MAG TPA: patatin-like phospholipase family protein [Euzebyales bacterium]
MSTSDTTGLVLAAGGARGAYQAGALAELLPALAQRGATPTLLIGESVGALNSTVLGAHAHERAQVQAEALVDHWLSSARSEVLAPLWRQLPAIALQYAGETLGVPGLALRGLLSVTPLRRMLDDRIGWDRMHRNVADGVLDAIGVTATAVVSGRSVTFVERAGARPLPDEEDLDYHAATLGTDHVIGSAAIPMLFPPSWIDEPSEAAAWYVDGSTRLHTPLRPALDLGADRLVVIGTTSLRQRERRATDHRAVDLGDTAVTLLHAMVEDSLRRDVRRLARINTWLAATETDPATVALLRGVSGRPPYRDVPFIAIAPGDPYEIGDLARAVFHDRYGGWRALRDPDIEVMHRLLGGDSPLQGEVLSFVLFDEVFHAELVALGRRDARRWLRANDGAGFRTALDA